MTAPQVPIAPIALHVTASEFKVVLDHGSCALADLLIMRQHILRGIGNGCKKGGRAIDVELLTADKTAAFWAAVNS